MSSWNACLSEAKRLLADEKDLNRRKELRLSIRGLETLIGRNAPFPSEWESEKHASTNGEIGNKSSALWDKAITDAKKSIARLESAIEVFERRKKAGEPWPAVPTGEVK
jgi:hypothetical protein